MTLLLCLIGPTATGKTKLAEQLASHIPSVLISADSRQVYRGLDVVSGKDHLTTTLVYGVDLVAPDEPCSVAVWYSHIKPALLTDKLPIVVGGTGLYVKALTDGIASLDIPPNLPLRNQYKDYSVSKLQAQLSLVDIAKLKSMNQSDLANPRRLIRALEIAAYRRSHLPPRRLGVSHQKTFQPLLIGLRHFDDSKYRSLVRARVISRLDYGAVEETLGLLRFYAPSLPSFSALGYKHILKHLQGQSTRQELIESWTNDELAYAKRQLTWFNKLTKVHWFDPGQKGTEGRVVELVKSWYHSGKADENTKN